MSGEFRSAPLKTSALLQQTARPWLSCLFAALAISLGLAVRLSLIGVIGDQAVFLMFVPGIVIAAALGGLWPGLFATALGGAAGGRG